MGFFCKLSDDLFFYTSKNYTYKITWNVLLDIITYDCFAHHLEREITIIQLPRFYRRIFTVFNR